MNVEGIFKMDTEKQIPGKGEEKMATARKETMKETILSMLATAFNEETELATQEMKNIRENAVKTIVEEQKIMIRQIVEDEKEALWTLASTTTDEPRQTSIEQALAQSSIMEPSESKPTDTVNPTDGYKAKKNGAETIDIEVLPPRDQNEIAAIHSFLNNMPELLKIDFVTMVDKTLFKIVKKEPVNLVERLIALPQVLTAKEVIEDNQKKITITLLAKLKLERNNVVMNDKVNEIFSNKKR